MRTHIQALLLVLLIGAPVAQADQRLVTFLFGPALAESARQGARAAAGAARQWLQSPGADVELRRAGSPGPQPLDARAGAKGLEQAFVETALQARDADPATFLTALDAAAQAAALHPGMRVLVAVLNSPPLSSEAERTLEHLVDLCRTSAVRVIVLDITQSEKNGPDTPLDVLAKRTGGVSLHQARALESSILVVARPGKVETEEPAAVSPAAQPASAPTAPSEIPVHTRFIRTSSTGSTTTGTAAHVAAEDTGIGVSAGERAYEANDATGPMRGLMMAEAPLNALRFDVDDNTGTYLARARMVVTVRNLKGVAVWSGQKELNIRGPVRGLETRRQGSLLFMRGAMLPGGEGFTLEAKVEDLLAGRSGVVRTPLRTGKGAPGLMASDALFVRPFKGSSDKFEADQVFSYEGEALSPVLNPVFRAGQPVNLQLYVVLYPDIHSGQPDLSLELSRDGRVVSRVPVQFKSQILDPAREGSFSSLAGKGSAVMGGQAHEFPYLANIKGAKLSAGNYEAVISIRQGRNVITRNVAFRVMGDAATEAATTGGPKATLAPRPDAEEADVVLPEIEPATVDSSGLAMPPGEQKRLWDAAAANARDYSSRLPNFRCTQETHRFTAPAKTPDLFKEADSFKDELTYEDGKESYRTVEVDGVKVETEPSETKGVHSRGEFGSMLQGIFDPEVGASYKWAGRAMAMGVLCQVFDIEVARAKSNFTLNHNGRTEPAGYTGRVFIDEETGLVRRLTILGVGLPKDFGLQSPAFSLEYEMVRIGADDHLVPLRSVLQLKQLKTLVRNETVFRGYRRFEASSGVKFDK